MKTPLQACIVRTIPAVPSPWLPRLFRQRQPWRASQRSPSPASNFSPTIAENQVYFDATPATILTASATQLTVRAPNLVKDTVALRVSVYKSDKYSESKQYQLLAAVSDFGGLAKTDEPYGGDR